jgi:murein L,D-transpeptidase YafK
VGRETNRAWAIKKLLPERYKVAGFKSNSDFFYFIRLNYPNENDARRGFKDRLINKHQYDAILDALDDHDLTPPQDTQLGGAIGIHGIGEESQSKISMHNTLDWTQGCIALRNHEVEESTRFSFCRHTCCNKRLSLN